MRRESEKYHHSYGKKIDEKFRKRETVRVRMFYPPWF
jgi:hypothetical protein